MDSPLKILQKGGSLADSTEDKFNLKIHHCGLYVPDLESSINWYRDIFGFEVHMRLTIEQIPAKVAFIKRGDFFIELFEVEGRVPTPEEAKSYGTKHMAFVVENFNEFMDNLKQKGVEIIMEGKHGDIGMAFIKDNYGISIEIVEVGAP